MKQYMTIEHCCSKCKFWEHTVAKRGKCVLNPPVAYYDDEGHECYMWPETFETEWCGSFKESCADNPQPRTADNNAETRTKEKNMFFDKLFNFDGLFGHLAPGLCRIGANGQIAIKTTNGYKTYNVKTGRLVNVSNFCLNIGDEMFFSIPTNKVEVGYNIIVNRLPRCVIEVKHNAITVLTYENNTIETVVPERHMFMGNVYFYGRIMSPFANMMGGKGGGMKKLLQMGMMSKMLGSGGDPTKVGSGGLGDMGNMGNLMMMSMFMGGKDSMFGDMFEGMFDGADDMAATMLGTGDDDDDDTDGDKPTVKKEDA